MFLRSFADIKDKSLSEKVLNISYLIIIINIIIVCTN